MSNEYDPVKVRKAWRAIITTYAFLALGYATWALFTDSVLIGWMDYLQWVTLGVVFSKLSYFLAFVAVLLPMMPIKWIVEKITGVKVGGRDY